MFVCRVQNVLRNVKDIQADSAAPNLVMIPTTPCLPWKQPIVDPHYVVIIQEIDPEAAFSKASVRFAGASLDLLGTDCALLRDPAA